ncbi:unnamed protein product [Acanthosepion pharaonis]|uniref:Uncharacterized protein n=1 Tax=Acanthosepion pharaonis TaxID=158019 RepID=A0A812CBY4_ACAPH|nr:unnamed protein product [Sepia pharaonis]
MLRQRKKYDYFRILGYFLFIYTLLFITLLKIVDDNLTLPFHFNSISFKLQIKYAQTFCFVSPGRGVRPSYSLGFFSSLSINLLSPHLFLSCFLTLNFILSLFLSLSLYLSLSLSLYLSLCPPVQYFSLYFTPNHFSSFILSILFPFISNLFSKFISFFLLSHSLPCPAYAWDREPFIDHRILANEFSFIRDIFLFPRDISRYFTHSLSPSKSLSLSLSLSPLSLSLPPPPVSIYLSIYLSIFFFRLYSSGLHFLYAYRLIQSFSFSRLRCLPITSHFISTSLYVLSTDLLIQLCKFFLLVSTFHFLSHYILLFPFPCLQSVSLSLSISLFFSLSLSLSHTNLLLFKLSLSLSLFHSLYYSLSLSLLLSLSLFSPTSPVSISYSVTILIFPP